MSGLPPTVTATLRGARLDRGWRTGELARKLHCTRRWVERVEGGDATPSGSTLELWLMVLGVDRAEFESLHTIRDLVAHQ